MARSPVLEFPLWDFITDLANKLQLPVAGRVLVGQPLKADLHNAADTLLPACGIGSY
jgi:hypothetical protein